MASYTLTDSPYADPGYVSPGYTVDGFVLSGIDADLRSTGGLAVSEGSFALTAPAAGLFVGKVSVSSSAAFNLSLVASALRSNRIQRAHLTSFTLAGIPTPTFANWRLLLDHATFTIGGFPAGIGRLLPAILEGLGASRDISDQSKAYELLRRAYGGSDSTSPSFLRPQYVKLNSLSKSKDFGPIESLTASLSGTIGTEVGSSTHYFRVECVEPVKIRYTKQAVASKYDTTRVSIGLLDSERKPIDLDPDGFASPPQSDDERLLSTAGNTQQGFQFLPAGVYFFTVTSNQWRSCEYAVEIFIGGRVSLSGTATFELEPTARVAQSYLNGTAQLSDDSFGNIEQTWDLEGIVSGTTEHTLTLTRTSPYSTT